MLYLIIIIPNVNIPKKPITNTLLNYNKSDYFPVKYYIIHMYRYLLINYYNYYDS